MKITINDVAKKAQVSKTTVSRYLNGKYEFMSEETKTRIEEVISELDYKPNSIARSLKNKNSKIIGCMIADIENQFSSYIFKGISEVCKKNGYRLLITEISNNEEDEIEAIESLISYNIDGLIINTTGSNDEYLIDLSSKTNFPLVLADRSISQNNIIDTVTSNNYSSTYGAMEFLKNQGYDKVAFLGYELANNSIRKLRYNAYIEAMRNEFKLDGTKYAYIFKDKNSKEFTKALEQFIEENKNERIALFSMNGTLLLELLQNLKKLNYDIEKDDIGICSFDDWGWAELVDKNGITTISQRSYECGVRCAELVIERIKNKNKTVEYIELPTKLVIRGSTKKKRRLK